MPSNNTLTTAFEREFGYTPEAVVHAPGRVNLIGEHTDYNEGFVFPAAINFGTWIAASKRTDGQVKVTALDYNGETNTFELNDIQFDEQQGWANYIRGVTQVLLSEFPEVTGADMVVTGNVPQGAGLSSSASFEIAILRAFSTLFNLPLDGVKAALMGQKAENEFVGCSCGIMDQLISAMGKEHMAMLLDCESLHIEHSPLPDDLQIVIINSNVKRGLVDSEYNLRREQCEQAAEIMGVKSLRLATLEMLEAYQPQLPEAAYKRAHHIVTENARTLNMYKALQEGDIATVSKAMAESHVSMRDDFEITVPPIDFLVEIISQVIGDTGGVRMTGGGFGGCVVALVPKDKVKQVEDIVEQRYEEQSGLKATIYVCSAEQGAFA